MENQAVTIHTEEILYCVSKDAILRAEEKLALQTELVDINIAFKNWDTAKRTSFEKAVLLQFGSTLAKNEATGEIQELECVFFMDENKNVYYKAAYQFVKAMRRLPLFSMFTAKFVGTEKAGKGNAEVFDIRQLLPQA